MLNKENEIISTGEAIEVLEKLYKEIREAVKHGITRIHIPRYASMSDTSEWGKRIAAIDKAIQALKERMLIDKHSCKCGRQPTIAVYKGNSEPLYFCGTFCFSWGEYIESL